jgi:hypothetical protein
MGTTKASYLGGNALGHCFVSAFGRNGASAVVAMARMALRSSSLSLSAVSKRGGQGFRNFVRYLGASSSAFFPNSA